MPCAFDLADAAGITAPNARLAVKRLAWHGALIIETDPHRPRRRRALIPARGGRLPAVTAWSAP